LIYINTNYCKGCLLCVEYCPQKVYVKSEKLSKKGVFPPEVKYSDKCVKCHLCELMCPDFAIIVEDKDDK